MSRATAILLTLTFATVSLAGCAAIKRRLPPPEARDGRIEFLFEAPSARLVQLAGNWPENDWLAGQAQTGSFRVGEMDDADGDGVWSRVEALPPGRYEYKFVIDGVTWKEDPNNPEKVDDGFGGFNSLLIVD